MSDHSASSGADTSSAAIMPHDQTLWRALTAAETDTAFGEAWLGLTCRMIPGATAALLLLLDDGKAGSPVLVAWPPGHRAEPALMEAAQAALAAGRGTVQPLPGPRSANRLAYPVQLGDTAIAAAAFEVSESSGQDIRQAMRQVQWASAWLRDYRRGRDQAAIRAVSRRMELALDLLAAVMEEPRFKSACRVTATELATRFDCERVSIGFRKRQQTEVIGISHSAQFGRSMNLVRLLADAMDEALDQQGAVLYPTPDDDIVLVTRAHEALATAQSAGFVLTIPIFVRDQFIGAVTFERASDRPFDQTTIDLAEAVSAVVGPALLDKQEVDKPLPAKLARSVADLAIATCGPGSWRYKIALASCVAALVFGLFARGTYRIAADARIEGTVQRSIVAPFDGFVAEATVKAGDTVQAGQLIATIDDRDLNLERLRWTTERQQHLAEYDQALSQGKRADAARFRSLADEAAAQTRLVDEQLARTKLTAPFSGLIVSGDLSQSIGAPVRRGDSLFEVAPLDNYRVVLWVNESQIADVHPEQHGTLLITALTDVSLPLTIKRVTPVAEVRDGRMVFQVDAELEGSLQRLRPRMEGLAKIEAGRQRLVWIWFRSLLHWARVQSWAWLP
jgi:multidrug efflux pump subunit AcrA (membrane-fusion protein)